MPGLAACGRIAFDTGADAGTGIDTPDAVTPFCNQQPFECPANAICDDFEDITATDFPAAEDEGGQMSTTTRS